MRDLGPDRLSEDGRYLLLRDDDGRGTYRVPIDRRLRSLIEAAASTRSRTPGQMELTMQSTLSPRDIQTRVRRGETVAQVAEAAGVPTEQIEGFAGPVLAERAYMSEQARSSAVRRKHVDGSAMALGVLVEQAAADDGASPDDVGWDAWRREDGRWSISVVVPGRDRAMFLFDHKSRFAVPADEAAHELVRDVPTADASAQMAIADALQAQEPVPAAEPEVTASPEAVAASISSLKEARDRRAQEQQLSLQDVDEDAEVEHDDVAHDVALEEDDSVREHGRIAVPDTGVTQRRKKAERRRVPSWDEIMFGGRED
ncbi:septation protein SepH [Aeromicrobium halocynthiae]